MTSAQPKAKPSQSGLAYNLAMIVALVLLAIVGLAYVIDKAGRTPTAALPSRDDTNLILQTVAGRELAIPQSWFRYGEQLKEGFSQQVDLRFALLFSAQSTPSLADVTLLPLTRARASSTLLDSVYVHQLTGEMKLDVPGLVGKALMAKDGYEGEVVWYDAISAKPFVAKCAPAPAPERPQRCLRTVHLPSGLAAVINFDATALTHWREFDDQMALWLGQIGAL